MRGSQVRFCSSDPYFQIGNHRARRVLHQQLRQRLVQLPEPLLRAHPRMGFHDTAVERDKPPPAARDDAVAGVRKARVDSKHDHLFGSDSARPTGPLPAGPATTSGGWGRPPSAGGAAAGV